MARAPRFIAAVVGAVALWAAVPVAAQQAANTNPPAKKTATKPVTHAAGKPTTSAATKLTPAEAAWTLQDALPSDSTAVRAPVGETPKERSPFGRIQLDTGSVGVETEPKFKDNTFADGRKVPGLETDKRNAPSYFGLSLSVPTSDKSILPLPLLPRRE
jgi:hypothetical protein